MEVTRSRDVQSLNGFVFEQGCSLGLAKSDRAVCGAANASHCIDLISHAVASEQSASSYHTTSHVQRVPPPTPCKSTSSRRFTPRTSSEYIIPSNRCSIAEEVPRRNRRVGIEEKKTRDPVALVVRVVRGLTRGQHLGRGCERPARRVKGYV